MLFFLKCKQRKFVYLFIFVDMICLICLFWSRFVTKIIFKKWCVVLLLFLVVISTSWLFCCVNVWCENIIFVHVVCCLEKTCCVFYVLFYIMVTFVSLLYLFEENIKYMCWSYV